MKTQLKTKICATLLFVTAVAQAQVSNYTFSQKVVDNSLFQNYTANGYSSTVYLEQFTTISKNAGKYLYMSGTKDTTDLLTGEGFDIGFDFNYDGQWMDRFGISSNCYIKLGNSKEDSLILFNDYNAGGIFESGKDSLRRNVIGGLQKNSSLIPASSMALVCYLKDGCPGNRSLKIDIYQPMRGISFFTITLREWKNQVDFFYGIYLQTPPTFEAFCGLRGKAYNNDAANLNIREGTSGIHTWSSSVKGDSPNSHCDYNINLTPPNGLVYTFTPPAPDTLRAPVAFFKCNPWDSIPNFISIIKTFNTSTFGYVFANRATEIPTNPTLSWSPEYTSSTNYYDLYLGTDSLDMDLLADSITATDYALPTLAAGITYYYKIIAYNNVGVAQPCVGSFTTANTLAYCSHMYAHNGFIKTIIFNTLAYTHPEEADDVRRELPFEAPYTTTLQRDSSYLFTITLQPGMPCSDTRCWIDFNQDGVFDTNTEQFNKATTIIVPHNAVLGTTKMRVGSMLCTAQASRFNPCYSDVQYQDYTITIAPNEGCADFNITALPTNPSCFGENNGEIRLNLSNGTSPYNIQWEKDGEALAHTSQTLSGIGRGTYQAFVTDSKDCSVQTDLLVVTQPLPLIVDTLTVNGLLTVNANGGTKPYFCEWSGENNTIVSKNCTSPDSAGVYKLTVTDANSCSLNIDSITIQEQTPNAVRLVKEENTLSVFPNPVRGLMTVSAGVVITKVEVTNMSGKILYTRSKLNSKIVNVSISHLPNGLYLIKAYTSNGIETKEIIKQ